MTYHTPEQASQYVTRLMAAMHADDVAEFERTYFEALATSDPSRPMFRIVNMLAGSIVNEVRAQVANEYGQADNLIRDALKDVDDPWAAAEPKGDTP